eukprot:1811830-Amphidinium_carterae.1
MSGWPSLLPCPRPRKPRKFKFAEFNGGQVLPLSDSRAVATTSQRFVEAAILLCVLCNSNVLHELVTSARLKGGTFE